MQAKYSDIRESLQTGDIVLFSGNGLVSASIKWVTKSQWSHVGMILKLPEWNMVLLWESTKLTNLRDIESNKFRKGVQLVALSQRIATYDGNVAIRQLDVDRTISVQNQLVKFREEIGHRPYEEKQLQLLKSAYEGVGGNNKEDLSSLFCSELVAEAYQKIGWLDERLPSNEYTPKNFSSESEEPLILQRDIQITDEIWVEV